MNYHEQMVARAALIDTTTLADAIHALLGDETHIKDES